jgi:hypothetical protein
MQPTAPFNMSAPRLMPGVSQMKSPMEPSTATLRQARRVWFKLIALFGVMAVSVTA